MRYKRYIRYTLVVVDGFRTVVRHIIRYKRYAIRYKRFVIRYTKWLNLLP